MSNDIYRASIGISSCIVICTIPGDSYCLRLLLWCATHVTKRKEWKRKALRSAPSTQQEIGVLNFIAISLVLTMPIHQASGPYCPVKLKLARAMLQSRPYLSPRISPSPSTTISHYLFSRKTACFWKVRQSHGLLFDGIPSWIFLSGRSESRLFSIRFP